MRELAGLDNPFRDTVVQDAWQAPADVAAIHEEAFRACLDGLQAAGRGVPDSLLVYGAAGAGKTHLLSRLQRHLLATAGDAPDRVLRCVFVFVRLQTSPLLLWQHVRRRLASDLMRKDQGVTQLQRLVAHQLGALDGRSPRVWVMALRVLRAADQETLAAHFAELAQTLGLSRDLCVVLEHLVCGRFVRDAGAWLAGDSLPDAVLSELGLGPDLVEDREEVARATVTDLCRLAGETLPIVFCFDQVEALQRGLADADAFFRFGRLAADLCDADPNVFAITCLQSAVMDSFKAAVREADRDRFIRRSEALDPLTPQQVRALILARLRLVPELAAMGRGELHPFDDAVLERLAVESPCTPRRVLTRAAQEYEARQHGRPAGRIPLPQFLAAELEQRAAAAARTSDPSDTRRVILQGLEPLTEIGDLQVLERELGTADFALEHEGTVFVEIRNEADGRSLAPRLKRLLQSTPRPDGGRSVVLRDPRLPISRAAVKTREYLSALRERGVQVIEPTVEALAALAALSELLADAKSGDLAVDGETVSGGAVLEWLRGLRPSVLVEPVQDLVAELVRRPDPPGSGEAQPDLTEQDLAELVQRERAVAIAAAAAELAVPAQRLVDIARRRSDRFLLLEGPPEVVLDVAGITPEVRG